MAAKRPDLPAECAWQESNLRPCAPEAHALSPELQARRGQSSDRPRAPKTALLPDRGAAAGAEVAVEVLHPVSLSGRELVVAGVERVVHVVVDRVGARQRARIEPFGTTGSGRALRRRVGDVVALVVAAALERVQE